MRLLFALILIASCAVMMPARAQNDSCFDDKNLEQIQSQAQQRGTLIYVWSPRMVYSVHNAAMASRAAAAAGLDFVVLHDMRLPDQELMQVREARHSIAPSFDSKALQEMDLATPPFFSPLDNSRPLCSEQLVGREALRHFPTSFVINAHGIHPHAIVGAMPWSAWVSSLDQRRKLP